MKHYKKIAKTVKLQLTKIDHTNLIAKREFQRIEQDYFEHFKTECYQMLKSLQVQNLLLQKITIQVFEMKPLESIEIVNSTFAQRFYKALQNQQQQQKDQKRYSLQQTNKDSNSKPSFFLNSSSNNQKIQQNQRQIQQDSSIQQLDQQQIQQNKQNISTAIQNLTIEPQQNKKMNEQPQSNNIIQQQQFVLQNQNLNHLNTNNISNKHSSLSSLTNDSIKNNYLHQINEQPNNDTLNNLNKDKASIQSNKSPYSSNGNLLQKEDYLIQTMNKNNSSKQAQNSNSNSNYSNNSINWYNNRMTPVSEGVESEKQSSIADNTSHLKFQSSVPSNAQRSFNVNNNRDSLAGITQQPPQKNARSSLNDIKLNLNNLYANYEEQESIGKLLLSKNKSNDDEEEEYKSDDSLSCSIIDPNKRKSKKLPIPESILEDEERSNFTFQPQSFSQNRLNSFHSNLLNEKESPQEDQSNFIKQKIYDQDSISNPFKEVTLNKKVSNQSQSEKQIASNQGSSLSEFKENSMSESNSQGSKQDYNSNLLAQKKQYLNEKFTCPLCGNQIDCKGNYSYINNHIDKCLSKQNEKPEAADERGNQLVTPPSQITTTINQDINNKRRPITSNNEQPQQIQSLTKQSKRGRPLGSKNSSSSLQKNNPQPQSNSLFAFGFKK